MAINIISHMWRVIRRDLAYALPRWVRVMFLAEPMARIMRFDGNPTRGTIQAPISILSSQGDAAGRRNVDVVLPREMLLERTIAIPPSHVSTHNAIAELNLLRRTPFNPTEIYWVLNGDATSKSEVLLQWVAKKSDIAQFRAMLSSHGLQVRRFLVDGESRPAVLADFTPDIAPYAGLWCKLNLILLIGAVAAGFSLWLQPAWQAREAAAEQLALRDALRNEALGLRSDIEALNQLDSKRAAFIEGVLQHPKAVDALQQMTIALPDHVWVTDLSFTAEQISINGETSQSAADLVLALTDAELPYQPALTGPVSRTAEGKERFGIVFIPNGSRQ